MIPHITYHVTATNSIWDSEASKLGWQNKGKSPEETKLNFTPNKFTET